MQINVYPKASNQISAYFFFFLIYSNQVGVGVLGFQRIIVKEAGYDAWISVLLGGLAAHFVLWLIGRTLQRYPSSDLYGINCDVFGQRIGHLLNYVYMLYFVMVTVMIVRSYIEVLQTWMFNEMATWIVSAVVLGLALYTILGGIRVITGYTFITFLMTVWLICFLYFPFQHARWSYLYPMANTTIPELLEGARRMSVSLIGFEIFYLLYPFAKNKKKIGFYSQFGMMLTNFLYLLLIVLALTFFSARQLEKTTWATLTLQQMVHLPFVERFEMIIVSIWLLVIMPNIMLFTWSVARGFKRMHQWSHLKSTLIVLLVIFIGTLPLISREQVYAYTSLTSQVGFIASFVYPIFLYLCVVIKDAFRKRGTEEVPHDTGE